jgi:tetratricopeptide (TPR) repeat protein
MLKTTNVAILLLVCNTILANDISIEINRTESQWASIYYSKNTPEQRKKYPLLLRKTKRLIQKHPASIELIIWQAIIISSNAAYESPFTALESLDKAKKLLDYAIQKDPNALEGAAFVTLGTLYYMTPGWPISFGDQNKAEILLKKGLKINPFSIDANYFYGDFLLSKGKLKEATKYFRLALKSPSRNSQEYADSQLKKEATIALKNTEQKRFDSEKAKLFSLFFSASSN